MHEHYAKNIVWGFARSMAGPWASLPNSARVPCRTLDINASVESRPIRAVLRRLHIPLITFEDVPGSCLAPQQELWRHHTHGAKTFVRVCRSTVPKSR